MKKEAIFITILIFILASCARPDTTVPDALNSQAYRYRYIDVDASLDYANKAYEASAEYPDGRAEAISHQAFVKYQQMRFTEALRLLDKIDSLTNNQVELLCADVLRMKISQRTGELHTFYRAWHNAEIRLGRIDEELHLLSKHLSDRVLYARTEMHIIASTYYFYTHQDSASREELKNVESYMMLPRDTAQWSSYMYMLGAGGVLAGDSVTVLLKEFDHLTHVLTISRRRKDLYFQANSLQALSSIMENPDRRRLISENRGGGMDFVRGQYATGGKPIDEDSLSLELANSSLKLFRRYGDRFQTANVLRTKAELLFRQERYGEALQPLAEALTLLEEQHRIGPRRLPYWEAAIYERLSLTYSALGDSKRAMENRAKYLSLVNSTRQDLEEKARAEELQSYNYKLYIYLTVIAILMLAVCIMFFILARKVKRRGKRQEREAEEALQLTKDETCAREMELAREKLANIERRAKVSLAENVVPYINRMLNTKDMEYVAELSAEILRVNDILTEWIQVKQGKVAMNISTFALQPLLDTIGKSRATYIRKGLTLEIPAVHDVYVKADRALTLFMINTLCDNARKFTPEGGKVSIMVKADDGVVEISVSDTGCGISAENVDTINNSKVFKIAASKAVSDSSDEGKGFGFGLMNCKGIIGQMKKMSSRFQCCDFGVESTEGKGSRFWFRLPRVMSVLMCLISTVLMNAQTDYGLAKVQKEMMYEYNAAARFEEARRHGQLALKLVPEDSIYLRMQIENGMAEASQGLCLWDEYREHNVQYLLLHRIYTADPNLPVYARRLHMLKSEITWSQFFTPMLMLCSVFFLVLMVRRSNRRRGELQQQMDMQQQQEEMLNRVQYELDRVHIQNRILDNCLSTIKHETMYYPARVQQMALNRDTDTDDLRSLMNYYNEVYTILLEQAQKQTSARLAMDESVLAELKRRINAAIGGAPVAVAVKDCGKILEIRIHVLGAEIADNLFTPEAGNLDAFVAREIVRMHDAACGYPGLRLYVENNEIIITLWKNSRLLSSKMFSWN